jgi:hypothetical protein
MSDTIIYRQLNFHPYSWHTVWEVWKVFHIYISLPNSNYIIFSCFPLLMPRYTSHTQNDMSVIPKRHKYGGMVNIPVFWDMVPCRMVHRYDWFGGTCNSHPRFRRPCRIEKRDEVFVMSVCPSVYPMSVRMEQLGSHSEDFHEIWHLRISRKSVEEVRSFF